MKNTPARGPRSAPYRKTTPAVEARETATSRFEFARRHILTQQKLEAKVDETRMTLWNWFNLDEYGSRLLDRNGLRISRKAKTPDEREELKTLENAVVDARAKLLLHENDGRLL